MNYLSLIAFLALSPALSFSEPAPNDEALGHSTDLPPTICKAFPRPNVIFILTDDQGYGDTSANGHPLLKTPHFDRIRNEGVRLENFYVSPSCSPTRAALLTGMHEFRNGVTHTRHPRQELYKEAITLPQLLTNAGYRTALIGKWHLGERDYTPNDAGFDLYAFNYQGMFDGILVRNEKRVAEFPGKYREDLYFDEAMEFIDGCGDQPFFCEVATVSPHAPLDAPEEFIAPFRGKVSDEEATYLGMVMNIDYNLGRLLDFLEERELDENTIIVLMNDNGATYGLDLYNAGMRGCKTTPWQGGSRAFSFWRWPSRWTPHEADNLTSALDFLPTICQLTGTDIPEPLQDQLDGFSLVPLLEAEGPVAWHDDRMLFIHAGRWTSGMAAEHKYYKASVFQDHHLLVRSHPCDSEACRLDPTNECVIPRGVKNGWTRAIYTKENAQFHWGITAGDRWELYDLEADPACANNLAEKDPERSRTMAEAYDAWWDAIYPEMIARGGDVPLVIRD